MGEPGVGVPADGAAAKVSGWWVADFDASASFSPISMAVQCQCDLAHGGIRRYAILVDRSFDLQGVRGDDAATITVDSLPWSAGQMRLP